MDITTHISIEGKEINAFVSLEIRQGFNAHHSFELVIKQDILIRQAHTLQTTQEYIGKFISIGFGANGNQDNFFKGFITESTLSQEQGAWGNLVLKGYSPTYLLEGGNHCASFFEKSLKNITEELTKNLAGNDLNLQIKPKFQGDINYCCQYNESNFQFLNRLAVEYGEWFYYDGQNLFLGKPAPEDPVKLTYGEHLERINFSLKLSPHKVNVYSYHAETDEVFTTSAGSLKGDPYLQKAIEVTDKLYRSPVVQTTSIPMPAQGNLDSYSKNQQGQQGAKTVVLTATGDNPQVKIGGKIALVIKEKDLEGHDTTDEASFLVVAIHHTLRGTGSYSHTFEALPADTEHIPAEIPKVLAETQVATVKDNADPKNLGRVKVQMSWQKDETTDWIRVLTPDAGSSEEVSKNRGFVFVPEKGDQVILGFEHHHPSLPFVLGSVFHGKNGAGGGDGNNVKTIKTRSGHTISLDDTKDAESIIISDKSGNEIKYDTKKKSLHITSTEDIELTAKNIKITAEENVEIIAKKKIGLASEGDMELIAEKELALQSEKDTTVKSGAGITLEATKDAILNGQNVTAEGKVKATFTGAQTKISGKMTAIQGAGGKIEVM